MKTVPALAAVLFATALIVPTVSHAEGPRSATVSYADLNLTSQAAQGRLQHRLVRAAGLVCEYGKRQDIARMGQAASCRSETLASVQPAYLAAIDSARHGIVKVLDGAALIITAH